MKDSIIVYSSPSCPKCKMLKMELTKKGVEYIDYNVEDHLEEVQKLGITSAPSMLIEGKIFSFKEAINWIREN